MLNRRGNLKALALASALVAGGLSFSVQAQTSNTIKVGILHSLSGTMAISETVLKDTVLMAIDEINAKGGVLGKKLDPWWLTPLPTGLCLLKKPSNSWVKTKCL